MKSIFFIFLTFLCLNQTQAENPPNWINQGNFEEEEPNWIVPYAPGYTSIPLVQSLEDLSESVSELEISTADDQKLYRRIKKVLRREEQVRRQFKDLKVKSLSLDTSTTKLIEIVDKSLNELDLDWEKDRVDGIDIYTLPAWANLQFVGRRLMSRGLSHFLMRVRFPEQKTVCMDLHLYGKPKSLFLRFCKPKPRGRVCILVDDVGYTGKGLPIYLNMNMPVTISVLPFYDTSAKYATQSWQEGFEVMLHMPMLSSLPVYYRYENLIDPALSEAELIQRFHRVIRAVPHILGTNNHEGSKATQSEYAMNTVMRELGKLHHLYFIDSFTSQNSVAFQYARQYGIPASRRNFDFLDNTKTEQAIMEKIEELIRYSLANPVRTPITILHEKEAPARAMHKMLPEFRRQQIEIITPSEFLYRP